MSSVNNIQLDSNSLFKLNKDIWLKNQSVHMPSRGAMRPWSCRDVNCPLLAVLPDQKQIRDFAADASTLGLPHSIFVLPEMIFSDDDIKIKALKVARASTFDRFDKAGGILLATPASLMAPFAFSGEYYNFRIGETVKRDDLISWLLGNGYEKNDLVWMPGNFAVRGSIIDIFSPSYDYPLRLEMFDDDVESIRFFLPETQKSIGKAAEAAAQSLRSGIETEITDHFPAEMKILLFDPGDLDTTAENAAWLWNNLDNDVQEKSKLQSWEGLYKSFAGYERLRVYTDVYRSAYRTSLRKPPLFKGKLSGLKSYCESYKSDGYKIAIYSEAEKNLEWASAAGYEKIKGSLSEGFIDSSEKCLVLSDLELSGVSIAKYSMGYRAPADWGTGLMPGQWVAHNDYGVAKFIGSQSVETSDGEQEYLVLQFADDRRLLIPVLHFYKISPWSPMPGQEAVPDSLKGSHWKKSSEKARELAQKAAHELAEIYAVREITKGYMFQPAKDLMKDVEDSFTYTETVDQLKAICEVEADMEAPVPMDRLIVGDVGFGKTEIAIRAAAKAVFSGKQVALLVPTTLLAQQHFDTFSTRFADMPLRAEVISRFISISEQHKILDDLKAGKVDILIGTHRLLSSDIQFKDLGLLIIDEEHRFGVMHKEQLKKTAPGADVLMLSATPIPRTLSLSMSGLRDISILQTPPQRRLPVITVVRPWSEELLKSAVLREKNRGGQIFFVHNRINDIQERAIMLKRLFPKLKIAVAHSRTPETSLEKIMFDFSKGELDILICTTIVESGLDIPLANTLIVDDAQELGLAQMYQLRGRVGRREEQAYAFLFYPPDANLSADASERLEAIADLDELGAGYQLAQRDLQIRGGGDIIGIAQHGNSTKVGYQKYCDMLAEEIAKLKGEYHEQVDVQVAFPAVIPGDYLPQDSLRITLYRRLLKAEMPEEVSELMVETEDRFGKIPKSLSFLFNLAYVRCAARYFNISKIVAGTDETVLYGDAGGGWQNLDMPYKWMRMSNGLIGPGGFNGMGSICEALRKQYSANILK